MKKIKVILWGLGAMGGGIAKVLLEKDSVEVVGAIAGRPSKAGKDLGEVLELGKTTGILVDSDPQKVLTKDGDIVIHTTTSFTKEALPQIIDIINSGKNIITIAEEMSYTAIGTPDLSGEIDKLAKEKGVTVLGTGVNPGFVLDTLIIALTGVTTDVKKIKAARINDLSPFGATVMKTQGVGTTVEEFKKGIADGSIVGHIGFPESISLIAKALGWKLDEIKETREPIITNTYRETPHVKVQPGMVAGCKHIGYGYKNGEVVITLEHPQQIHPGTEGIETGDYILIEGTPNINMAIKPEIPGGIGTIAMATNMIPLILDAKPGVVTTDELPVPRLMIKDLMKNNKKGE